MTPADAHRTATVEPPIRSHADRLADARAWLARMAHGFEAVEDRTRLARRLASRWGCGVGDADAVLREVHDG